MEYTPVDEIPGIVATVRKMYKSGATRPLEWRKRQLHALLRMLEENEDAMAGALKKDLNKDRYSALVMELWDIVAQVRNILDNLDKLAKKETLKTPLVLKPMSYEVWKEPYGVVTIIAPWNMPFNLVMGPLAGALAAGNTCVIKPSEISAATCQLTAELIPKYFEPSVVGVVTGGVEQTTRLLAERVDSIMYTGGSKVGRIVMAAAAKNLTPVTLELGGKCPVYVDESANLQVSARRIAYYKNVNCGQICIAPDYVLVHHKVRDAFVEHVKAEHRKMFPGNEKECVEKGRIINAAHLGRVKGLLEGHGGTVVMGGETSDEERFVAFTVIVDPSPDSPIMQEEIFGPILAVLTVQSLEEAISFCNDRPTPLAAYVFERNPAVGKKWIGEVASGGGGVNDCMFQICNPNGGLGGKGESGMGLTRYKTSFETFTHRKVVVLQAPNFDPMVKYPPFDGISAMMKALITQQIPAWLKLISWGVIGAVAAGIALLVTKHVSVSFSVSFH